MTHIGIVGSGAVASLYGMMLQRAGFKLSLVCRSGFNEISESGIFVESTWGDFQFIPDGVYARSNDLPDDLDLLIIATKVYPDLDLPALLGPYAKGQCPILLIQNGIFIERYYQELFPNFELYSGLAFVCVSRHSYTHVEHIDYGRLDLGVYPKGTSSLLTDISERLKAVGMDCRVSPQIQRQRWEKLVWNAPFNPLSVLMQQSTSELLSDPKTTERIRQIMMEVCRCADLDGFPLDSDIVEQKIQQTLKMAPYKTSMLLDYESGRRLEYDAILGNLLSFAERMAIEIPYCRALYNDLLAFIKENKEESL